ncbi:CHRD domain-containing protein [Crenobacter sp. SG2303]|uniref:CHRD domain-containing protein n=1 Tax=Crenobacter oryzisoli TaxID=3056844 RepID=A0ABT7XIQ3_9NEIS|nr:MULTISPECIES: CHRD domain-containing protein [unclassified Crenobacter]MDN0073672.1 CHRD domain-containing protein [Crenobacter sp. SG2303]MDN0084040.1 CHRD domain-containing protein [Crenobacter sp. SG2305]
MKLFRLAAVACLLLSSSLVLAETVMFRAMLNVASEVPPKTGNGTGYLEASFDTNAKLLKYQINYGGLSGPAIAAHFHGPAPAGSNAGVQVPIQASALASPIKGQAVLTDDQARDLMAGNWYFNVHTAQNPGGEIRGQLTKAP